MSLPLGTALVATWTFTAAGVLYDPSPAPTVIEAAYPNGTALAGLPLALTRVRTGKWQAQVFATDVVTLTGTYAALPYTSDPAVDNPNGDGWAIWVDVGINSVSALTSAALAQFFAYAASAVTTAGSWAKYVADTLATIVSQTVLIGQIEITLNAPVVGFQIVPLVTNRSYKNSLGNPITFSVTGLAFALTDPGITIKMNVAVNGGTPQAFTGTATGAAAGYVDIDPTDTVDWLPAGGSRQYFTSELIVDDGADAVSIVKWQLPVEPGVGT